MKHCVFFFLYKFQLKKMLKNYYHFFWKSNIGHNEVEGCPGAQANDDPLPVTLIIGAYVLIFSVASLTNKQLCSEECKVARTDKSYPKPVLCTYLTPCPTNRALYLG